LKRRVVEGWRERVLAHCAKNPLTPALPPPRDAAAIWLCYGTTLLAALATPEELIYLQLGDGELLLVSPAGQVQRPWPRDPRWLGGATTSLCMEEACREMRCARQPLGRGGPAMVLLATDGYANAFRTERGFLRVGRDILSLVRAQGIRAVEQELAAWLEEASRLGSGDDATLAWLYRSPASAHGALGAPGAQAAAAE
ncbi:MAG: protein phosphatase 2C domain-containing protein, partial [Terriglobales bacterium]